MRVVLLVLLIVLVLDIKPLRQAGNQPGSRNDQSPDSMAAALLLMLVVSPWFLPQTVKAENHFAGFPPPELLRQMEERLLKPPNCLPDCAESPSMDIAVSDESLKVLFQVHAAVDAAVPLPGSARSWMPDKVLLDDQPAEGLLRDKDGLLWVLVPSGVHTATLQGRPPSAGSIQLPLPLKPHRATKTSGAGWNIQGIHSDGQAEGGIQLTRQKKGESLDGNMREDLLPPFLLVQRELSLGLNWQVETTVRRVTPPGLPVVAAVPVISGESVTTAGIRVSEGKVLLNMDPSMTELKWTSTLEPRPGIQLKASSGDGGVGWGETWVLDTSPIWHCELTGIPAIHHQDGAGHWKPQWQPWPGETVTIAVARPEAVPGQLITIDDARLELAQGERFGTATLALRIRSSQGGLHSITLPPEAQLDEVRIDGKTQPVRQQGRAVSVPIRPGAQTVSFAWHQGREGAFVLEGPVVTVGDAGQHAVNASVVFRMEPNRWIFWVGGPPLGPAVLFWSYLAVVILAAVGLGRITWTPLKTHHWLLLGLGLTQVEPLVAIMIVGWLLVLGLRERYQIEQSPFCFDLTQLVLAVWTLAALAGLYFSIEKGLLGIPQMQIAGNGSSHYLMQWTQDRIGNTMPRPWVASLPMLVYRVLMLLWALWLALALLKWLTWGWHCFSNGGLWRKVPVRRREEPAKEPKAPEVPPIPE